MTTTTETSPDLPGRTATAGRARTPRRSTPASVAICIAALAVVGVASLCIGNRWVDPLALLDASHPDHVFMDARLLRTGVGALLGAAFGVAGAAMQGLTRNPLADTGLLGVNAGAAFAMVAGITYVGAGTIGGYIWFGFIGAGVAAVAVHLIASLGRGGATPAKLVIAGAAVTAALSSWTTAILLMSRETIDATRRWQVGSVAGKQTDALLTALPFIVVGFVLVLGSARVLNALALGDDLARGLGRNTTRDRLVVGLGLVLLVGASVALAGPIAFLGLLVPHLVRMQVGGDYAKVLPLSAAWGAVLMVGADTVGRFVLPPSEIQVGVMIAVIGAPLFLVMIRRGRLGSL
ncbi:iron complex transport system permease protein [Nocardioides zeae]|uniref:Iron complex transport system permease protein n=2 Tax=Nocardioides zeae TaxID=1457234 RepID=A0ACC6IIY9_9ACTN|nr:iron ABC transporter permease [Nocardioides zeae]MDQ1105753.1 iron complex transport system permease protein [Nocardioides zeae]MDR6174600.1 iron complex transport system permease protein [Nocardioides zeae]MDR6210671.1 iron complex transport system permease protein [Nocardioides zeae]